MVHRPTSKVIAPLKNLLVSPKDKDSLANKSGAIYWFQCGDLTHDDEYIGETSRTFGKRFKENLNEPSYIHNHSINKGHSSTTQDNFQIIGKEEYGIARTIKESIEIRVNKPTLNRNIGKFNLHHIWDEVLLNTAGLKIKGHAQAIGHAKSTKSNTLTPLNQPNNPMQFFTGSMEHAQRTPLSKHVHRTS